MDTVEINMWFITLNAIWMNCQVLRLDIFGTGAVNIESFGWLLSFISTVISMINFDAKIFSYFNNWTGTKILKQPQILNNNQITFNCTNYGFQTSTEMSFEAL